MSAHNNNNSGGATNNVEKELEVETAVGTAYVRVGDSPREGRLPVTSIRDLETAQSEEVIVENEGSSIKESGPSSEGTVSF